VFSRLNCPAKFEIEIQTYIMLKRSCKSASQEIIEYASAAF